MKKVVDLRQEILPCYQPLLFKCFNRWLVLIGGAGSGKSTYAAQSNLLRILKYPGHKILTVRKTLRSCENSTFSLYKSLIRKWCLYDQVYTRSSEKAVISKTTGSKIIHLGLDDAEKIKSIQGVTSIWVEEATELLPTDLMQLDLRLRDTSPDYSQILLTCNPVSRARWLRDRIEGEPDAKILYTTFRDNPYLPEEYILALDKLEGNSRECYKEGRWASGESRIFDWPTVHELPKFRISDRFYGMDFGYNDPVALVEIKVIDNKFYLEECIYEAGLSISAMIQKMLEKKVSRVHPIYCDAARPDIIDELQQAGYRAVAGKKSKILEGIDKLKKSPIYTNPYNINLNAELDMYEWQTRGGVQIDEPIDRYNHAIDAIRYAMTTHQIVGTINVTSDLRQVLGI